MLGVGHKLDTIACDVDITSSCAMDNFIVIGDGCCLLVCRFLSAVEMLSACCIVVHLGLICATHRKNTRWREHKTLELQRIYDLSDLSSSQAPHCQGSCSRPQDYRYRQL